MHRFFVSQDNIDRNTVSIEGDVARQITKVLRLSKGDLITIMDGSGWEFLVELGFIDPRKVFGTVVKKSRASAEPKVPITLYQGILKGNKFDNVLQKGTELGVTSFVPVLCERSIPRGTLASFDRKLDRYKSIAREASELSYRGSIPSIGQTMLLEDAFKRSTGVRIILWEQEKVTGIIDHLEKDLHCYQGVSLFVGPEGGFTNNEIQAAIMYGLSTVSLGRRILRAETASLAGLVLVLSYLGEFNWK
tara:strand:- start:5464 stop:6207 length:744 start_codon:yes stop_codon:yes gene_type:complete